MFDSVCELFGEPFAICLSVVAILLLNVLEVLRMGGGDLLDRQCMVFQRMCVLGLLSQCAYRCSYPMLCLCMCMLEVISSFRSLRAGSQVVSLLIVSFCDFA